MSYDESILITYYQKFQAVLALYKIHFLFNSHPQNKVFYKFYIIEKLSIITTIFGYDCTKITIKSPVIFYVFV